MRASMTSRIHRVLRRVAISLALGAIVTVLVAWRCHRFAWMEGARTKIENPAWPITVPSTWPPAPEGAVRTEDGSIATESFSIVLPPRSPQVRRPSNDAYFGVLAYESGWPFRACVRYVAHNGNLRKVTEIDLGFIRAGVPGPFKLQWSSAAEAEAVELELLVGRVHAVVVEAEAHEDRVSSPSLSLSMPRDGDGAAGLDERGRLCRWRT
jgi:hypothetical protein